MFSIDFTENPGLWPAQRVKNAAAEVFCIDFTEKNQCCGRLNVSKKGSTCQKRRRRNVLRRFHGLWQAESSPSTQQVDIWHDFTKYLGNCGWLNMSKRWKLEVRTNKVHCFESNMGQDRPDFDPLVTWRKSDKITGDQECKQEVWRHFQLYLSGKYFKTRLLRRCSLCETYHKCFISSRSWIVAAPLVTIFNLLSKTDLKKCQKRIVTAVTNNASTVHWSSIHIWYGNGCLVYSFLVSR